jgi:hypothetical protein
VDDRLILSLCDFTGNWPQPYMDAGYEVLKIDLKHGGDVRLLQRLDRPVHGILAAPPCTVFASSGARWPRTDDDMREGLAIVDACLRAVVIYKPKWWALENPVGKLVRYLGKPTMYFNPCDYGDPWTKRTCLWGDFSTALPRTPVEASEFWGWRKLGGKSERTKELRSATPPGFAEAFFSANP